MMRRLVVSLTLSVSFCLLAAMQIDDVVETSTKEAVVDAHGDPVIIQRDEPAPNDSHDDSYETWLAQVDHWKEQVRWVRQNGGFVHEALEARRLQQQDERHVQLGVFATQDIPSHETLLLIPANLTINSSGAEDICIASRRLHEELQLKNESRYAPYINYLLATQKLGAIPVTWSKDGKYLFEALLSDGMIAMDDAVGWVFLDHCNVQPEEEFAFQLVRQRSWHDILIPVYDLSNHGNGRLHNTDCDQIEGAKWIQVRAKGTIREGDEVRNSYNVYPDSGDLYDWYATNELFRDYGFVQPFPQRWVFHLTTVAFELDVDEGGELRVSWLHERPDKDGLRFAAQSLEQLVRFGQNHLESRPSKMPKNEWSALKSFHDALVVALTAALSAAKDSKTCVIAERNCPQYMFDDLEEEPHPVERDRYIYTCDADKTHKLTGYVKLDSITSQYQHLVFEYNPVSLNTIFVLDGIIQQTTDFRPHYHEVFVHYAARFIDKVRRVLWIGGGDSMLLHDILKYPTLELAVGLELDQEVTRYSFMHFGAQPHFDNEKVEWWFGDATKSIRMLPKEYFGSFDMVLIDLSDTAIDLTVTTDLSIFGALALLLNKGGIVVKNGLFLEQFSRVFDYTLQSHYYDVPLICSQSFVLGSYDVDFLHRTPVDHGILDDTLFVKLRKDVQARFDILHDYRKNIARPSAHCKTDWYDPEPLEQTESPGILMIVEAEDLAVSLEDISQVQEYLLAGLRKAKMTVISTVISELDGGMARTMVFILKEGYVAVRTYPESSYCGFDVHLWGSYEKQEIAKQSLVSALGGGMKSTSTSLYRIIAGGMFGVATWQRDEENRGPRQTHRCDEVVSESPGVFTDQLVVDDVTRELLAMINAGSDIPAIVVCGKDTSPCTSIDVLSNALGDKITPIWTCPDLEKFSEKVACKEAIKTRLNEAVRSNGQIRVLVVDPRAPYEILKIIHSIGKDEFVAKKTSFFSTYILVLANSKNIHETWRRAFLDRFRRDFIAVDPVFRAQILFNNTQGSMEAGIVSSGDAKFVDRLLRVIGNIESKLGLVSEVQNIQGANFTDQGETYGPEHVFKPNDFDMTLPFQQWKSQKVMALQCLYQLEIMSQYFFVEIGEPVYVFMGDRTNGDWYPATVVGTNVDDDTVDLKLVDQDKMLEHVDRNKVTRENGEAFSDAPAVALSNEMIRDGVKSALLASKVEGTDSIRIHEYDDVGDGCLEIAFWSGGSAIVLWDGRIHIDINLFGDDDSTFDFHSFIVEFKMKIPALATVHRDEQPRGHGRVVAYTTEVEATGGLPVWALRIASEQNVSIPA